MRKNYKKIIWSVGILDKVILRWRRKGRGLSGFRSETHASGSSIIETETKEDDYDFLKEGRKQSEERLQKALARVKSMVQYPEARDQYRRLLNVVSEMQDKKVYILYVFSKWFMLFIFTEFYALFWNSEYRAQRN